MLKFEEKIDLIGTGYDYDNGKFLGITYELPKMPDEKDIAGYKLASVKQKWVRPILPSDYEIKSYSQESKLEIIKRELLRRTYGYWFYNNGVPVYITGDHYFYLTHWFIAAVTKDGYPQYRWANTLYQYFVDFCEKDEHCFGGIMLLNKRYGKTELGLSNLYNRATSLESNCLFGMQSLNATEAKNNLFKGRLMRSHKIIPNYLKPVSNETNSRKEIMGELRFMGEKDKDGNYKDALNNTIDHRPTMVSAYQGKRPREAFLDEPGTVEEMDIEEWYSTLREQLALGDKIFGKVFLPTTLETMINKGAIGYKNIWDKSDYNIRDANNRTQSGLYRYFKPYYLGREGFVDEYGNDRIEDAKKFRENFIVSASPEDARKHKRQYPETEEEAFDSVRGEKYDADVEDIISEMIKEAKALHLPSRKIRFVHEGNNKFVTAASNRDVMIMYEDVLNDRKYLLVTDGVKTGTDTGSKTGSKVCSLIIKIMEPDIKNDYPSYSVVCMYYERPQTKDSAYDTIISQFHYYNKFGGMDKIAAEGNDDSDTFSSRLKKEGLWRYIDKAKDLSGKGNTNTKKPFQYIDINAYNYQTYWMNKHIKKYPASIRSCIPLMEQMLMSDTENTDIDSAYRMLMIAYPQGDMKKKEKRPVYIHTPNWDFSEDGGWVDNGTRDLWQDPNDENESMRPAIL